MKYMILVVLMLFGMTLQAQEVEKDGKTYEVKKEKIFLDGNDVTTTLSVEDKSFILKRAAAISEKMKMQEKAEKAAKKLEKEMEKAEKAQKKAEKEQKRAEKALKKKEKAQDRYERAGKKYKDAQKKYEKLKRKGKLSPQDDAKWLDKLEDLKEDVEKAKKKM